MFRERALQRRARQEPLDDRLQITAPHEWLIVAALVVMLIALVAFGFAGSIERTASYEATVVLPGERHYLVAPASGTVIDVLVDVTDTVTPDQPIAYVRTSEAQHWESVIAGIVGDMRENDQLADEAQQELLRALLAVGAAAESTSQAEIYSLYEGEVAALDLVPGQPVSTGDPVGLIRAAAAGQPEMVAYVPPGEAARLRAGMEARVTIGDPGGGGEHVFPGQVVAVSAQPVTPPRWLAAYGLAIAEERYELRTVLSDEPNLPLADGSGVSLRIVLGRESLASILAPGGS